MKFKRFFGSRPKPFRGSVRRKEQMEGREEEGVVKSATPDLEVV